MKNILFNQQASELSLIAQKYLISILMVYILLFTLLACSSSGCDMNNPIALISGKDYELQIELAMNKESRRCGLSFRDQLADDQGMLFVFDQDKILSFWMKDTRMPLSIAFLTAQGKILNIRTMQPMNDTLHHSSTGPARYALEVNQDWFTDHRIRAGDSLLLSLISRSVKHQ